MKTPPKALSIIKSCREKKSAKLNLENLRISEVPPEIYHFDWLEELSLSFNNISKIEGLERLDKLSNLNISSNHITKIEGLEKLDKLSNLDLSTNQIAKIEGLENCITLSSLNLRHNQITKIKGLENCITLSILDLYNNQVTTIEGLEKLDELSNLDLSTNQIAKIEGLENCITLSSLNLRHNQIIKIERLENLKSLSSLNLRHNQIIKIEGLENLKKIDKLDLFYNQITKIEGLEKLETISNLNLSSNKITKIEGLEKLETISNLNLSSNKITKIEGLEKLERISNLDLSSNKITKIEGLEKLEKISNLSLRYNRITKIEGLEKLEKISNLDLSSNKITKIEGLEKLEKISNLDLSSNKITKSEGLEKLEKISNLSLRDNLIENINPLIFLITNKIPILFRKKRQVGETGIDLWGNPLKAPDSTIVQLGNDAILTYWYSIERAKQTQRRLVPINEIKILLVGEGMAGKTSLLKKIIGLPFNEHESQTHGVIIEKLRFGKLSLFSEYNQIHHITGRFWDFGGQEIMHASHQFFLSKRSIYILLIDSRTDAKKSYWLKHIEKFGGDSPVIFTINKIDDNKSYDVERIRLNNEFKNIENRFHRISCKTNDGIAEFVKELAELLPKTELINSAFSPDWIAIKEQLEKETSEKKYIDENKFREICSQNNVSDKTEQRTVLSLLDTLGIVLHFEELNLKNFYVLDPHWVTIGIYKIINSHAIDEGILKESMLEYILNQEDVKKEEYDPSKEKKIKYSTIEQSYLVKIMQEFELLYEYQKGTYLIPDLLPKEPKSNLGIDINAQEHIHFIMDYDFLPHNVISRFIIRMKADIHNIQLLWRTGVVLRNNQNGAKAVIKANMEKNRISICIQGSAKDKRDYFAVIHHALWEINDSFNSLKITEKMPLPDNSLIEVSYENLLGLESMGETVYKDGQTRKTYDISRDFLDKISDKSDRVNKNEEFDVKDQLKKNPSLSKEKAPTPPKPTIMEILKKYQVVVGLIFLAAFYLFASPGSKFDLLGFVKGEKGNDNSSSTINFTVIGFLKINNRYALPSEVKTVRIKNNAKVKFTTLNSSHDFILDNVSVPKSKFIVIEVEMSDGSLGSNSIHLENADADNVITIPEILLYRESKGTGRIRNSTDNRPYIIIKNQVNVNNGESQSNLQK